MIQTATETTTSEIACLIPNGKFTVISRKGGHRTFRIHTAQKGGAKGLRFASLLVGPDNQSSYSPFGILSSDWRNINVFRRLRDDSAWSVYARMLTEMLLHPEDNQFERLGYVIEGSRKCARCNRELTEPESIRFGIGPVCRGMM